MKKFLSIFVGLALLTTPVYAGKQDVLAHNVIRLQKVMTSFSELSGDYSNRNSLISMSMKIGELREVINSAQSMDVPKKGGLAFYYKAIGQFESGLDDFEHGIRDKNDQHLKESKKHFIKGREYMMEFIEILESERVS